MNSGTGGSTHKILTGDALAMLRTLPDRSVHCCVTSPPYWGLRDYGTGDAQIGLEESPEAYVDRLVAVFEEVRRVLRNDGTLWLNLGDSYSGSGKGGQSEEKRSSNWQPTYTNKGVTPNGLKPKDLVGIPWRVAFALQSAGWWLRSDIIWAKPNPMPESVTDRPTKAHEYVFLLSKAERYYYDQDAIREPATESGRVITLGEKSFSKGQASERGIRPSGNGNADSYTVPSVRNRRSVWTIATRPYPEAHFAVYPPALVEPCILAGTSARGVCPACGAPWVRVVERSRATHSAVNDPTMQTGRAGLNRPRVGPADTYVLEIPQHELARKLRRAANGREKEMREIFGSKWDHWTRTDKSGARVPTFGDAEKIEQLLGVKISFSGSATGWNPSCSCDAGDPIPATVLDPFAGSGTTLAVAIEHKRAAIGIELNPDYVTLIDKRLAGVQPRLFNF